jgi:hypothetical protein
MGLIREPLGVDFTVDPHVLTDAEKTAISKYIRDYKMKEAGKVQAPQANNKTSTRKREQVKS